MTCGRVWEAEAIEDGRLDASSVDSFERHAATCIDCTRALEALARLRDARLLLEPRRLSPFERRRNRAELLRRANSEALRPPRRGAFSILMFAAAAIVATFMVVRIERRTTASARPEAPAAAPQQPRFELRPIGSAEWHDATAGSAGRVVLATGTLGVHVDHLSAQQRFVVALPDGELEVHGTRFIVEVKGGRTERVLVTEGVVSLRLKGEPQRRLTAGESYVAVPAKELEPASTGEHGEKSEAAPARASAPSSRPAQAVARNAPLATAPPSPSPSTAGSRTPAVAFPDAASKPNPEAAGEAFHAAMASFSLGSYVEADERFAEFAARFPGDTRAEDAAFVRTVIALRRGDTAAAIVRARAYLRRFPDGLRRQEMERMLEAAKSSP